MRPNCQKRTFLFDLHLRFTLDAADINDLRYRLTIRRFLERGKQNSAVNRNIFRQLDRMRKINSCPRCDGAIREDVTLYLGSHAAKSEDDLEPCKLLRSDF